MSAPRVPPLPAYDAAVSTGVTQNPGAVHFVLARCTQGLSWRSVVAVGVFCAVYGGVLSVDPSTGGAPRSITAYLAGCIRALLDFLPVFVLVSVVSGLAPRRIVPRTVVLGLTVAAGLVITYFLISGMEAVMAQWQSSRPRHAATPLPLVVIVMCFLGLVALLLLEREAAADKALHESEEQRLNVAREMAEAQLQALQSQVEPHFLFNSLAHVRRLYQTDPRAGRATMQHLSRYLGMALRSLRETSISLSDDVALASAYLNIQRIRLGSRLSVEVDVPSEAAEARVPPLTIATLVENAIKHGIGPVSEGGIIRITARTEGQSVSAQVADTGQGFLHHLGTGVGLANLRARLTTLHGASAHLMLSQNDPRGVIATVVVPMPHVAFRQ